MNLYLGQKEVCAAGRQHLRQLCDCSKVAVGESQYIRFGEGEVQYYEALIYKRLFLSHEGLMSPLRDLVLHRYEEMQGLRT